MEALNKFNYQPKEFGIKEGFIRVWIKHSNHYGNGFFEYEYEVESDECSYLLDTLKEQYDTIEIVIAHLPYGDFMNCEELNEYLKGVDMYSIKVCECSSCKETKETRLCDNYGVFYGQLCEDCYNTGGYGE